MATRGHLSPLGAEVGGGIGSPVSVTRWLSDSQNLMWRLVDLFQRMAEECFLGQLGKEERRCGSPCRPRSLQHPSPPFRAAGQPEEGGRGVSPAFKSSPHAQSCWEPAVCAGVGEPRRGGESSQFRIQRKKEH